MNELTVQTEDVVSALNLAALPDRGLPAGWNRAPVETRQIHAGNDIEAINAWLSVFQSSPKTFINARKEIERLWEWATTQRGASLSGLRHEDMVAYQAFLADPQPRERWVADGHYHRTDPRWRFFTARDTDRPPLGPASQRQALVVINSCFTWLVESGYLTSNPLALSRRSWSKHRQKAEAATESAGGTQGRWMTQDEWAIVLDSIEAMPRETLRDLDRYSRRRWVMSLLYLGCLRISEAANAKMSHFYSRWEDGEETWWLTVIGKGEQKREVVVDSELLGELVGYRESCGLPPFPAPNETKPLVGKLREVAGYEDSITVAALHNIVKDAFEDAARFCIQKNIVGLGQRIQQASAHWLRHSGASHMLEDGVDVVMVRDQLGHGSIATTNTYLHTDERKRHKAIAGRPKKVRPRGA